jgi:hypothetical protein
LTQALAAKRQALRVDEAAHSELLEARQGAFNFCCQVSGWCGLVASAGCRRRALLCMLPVCSLRQAQLCHAAFKRATPTLPALRFVL